MVVPEKPMGQAAEHYRRGVFDLEFVRSGSRTAVGRQNVCYPFHFTRPFSLDAAIPSLLTVYQQSSSGGMYRADDLSCRYRLRSGAASHVTTQSATVVHDCKGVPARQDCEITLEESSFLALTPDPFILFPGASLVSTLNARLAPGAVLLLADIFAMHDPEARSRPFCDVAFDTAVRDDGNRLLVRDRFRVSGTDFVGRASPVGGWRTVASFLILGPPSRLPSREKLGEFGLNSRALIGVSALANGAGWGLRCLAGDAIEGRRVAESVFFACVLAAFGERPVKRRK